MSETSWRSGVWELLADLGRLVADRAPAEVRILERQRARTRAVDLRYHRAVGALDARLMEDQETQAAHHQSLQHSINKAFDAEVEAERRRADEVRQSLAPRFQTEEDAARDHQQDAHWQAGIAFDGAKSALANRFRELIAQLDTQWVEFAALKAEAQRILRRRWQRSEYGEPPPSPARPHPDPVQEYYEALLAARAQVEQIGRQRIPRIFEGIRLAFLWIFSWLVSVPPAGLLFQWEMPGWIILSSVLGLVLAVGLTIVFYGIAKAESKEAFTRLQRILAEAEVAKRLSVETLKAKYEQRALPLIQQRQEAVDKADQEYGAALTEIDARREAGVAQIVGDSEARLAEITARRDEQLAEAEAEHNRRNEELKRQHEAERARLAQRHARKTAQINRSFQQQWDEMSTRWFGGLEQFQSSLDEINRTCQRMFLDWNAAEWAGWTPSPQIPNAVPMARFDLSLKSMDKGIPGDQRLLPKRTDFSLPAMFPCRERPLWLLKTPGEGINASIAHIQSMMLRLLTAMPPSKVRFMIVDPVSLGENFAAFMHLVDYNEELVWNRIWTDTGHIEQRLAELAGHMENVIQVYLRNEFETIEEYNKFAGDLAEPYRILVVANFPSGFSEQAAARLASIVASGARCGVYTILSVDARMRMPRDFHMADLERHALSLVWKDGHFVWENPSIGSPEMKFLAPPASERFTEIVRRVGVAAKDADRVEVPFSCVVPPEPQWWTTDSRGGIDVPLGRAGAMKFQHLRLGRGTSQHVLISGKTGSGKSTLLHGLITNVALRYSPDEVELFLIDFKKGVEFKAYAEADLPHARVIAIESEREFGLSVLERLDVELKNRGDLFRSLGVQDVQGYRELRPDSHLPRILLVVDEFQELFVEDDRIAQAASLLLDRLVRQGRAFGIHVLLGSQTLAGSYSLPRSTIGQMAVRIALQCSEADAHMILSEDNTAARLLKRPGEAIYNDANGLFEGNHPFQVVWLAEHEREAYLGRAKQMAQARGLKRPPAIVFEGNAPADPAKNSLLANLLAENAWPEPGPTVRAWLGSAVAIKDPTSVTFARQTGNNLLVVGHQEEAALGLLTTCLVSLAAHHAPAAATNGHPTASFYVLDGARADSAGAGFWQRFAESLPHTIRVARGREVAEVLTELAAELARREAEGRDDDPPAYLVVYDLARFRDLRRAEDDFSFSRGDDKPANPVALLAKLLRDGPALGIHVLIWCDTYGNVNRALDRQGLREIELRVLFQMNANDSSNLIDTPVAAQLGIHRAVLYNEGDGRLEKFRPYGPAAPEWLAYVRKQFRDRLPPAVLKIDSRVG